MTAIFAGDETSTGDEGREGGASSAEGERTAEDAVAVANPPRRSLLSIAAKSAAAAKAQGEKAAAENAAAAAEKAAAAASRAAERRRQADLHTAKSVAAAEAAAAAVMAAASDLAAASAAAPAAVSAAAVSAAACSGHGGGQREDCTSGWPFHQATRAGPVGRSPSYTCLNPKLSLSASGSLTVHAACRQSNLKAETSLERPNAGHQIPTYILRVAQAFPSSLTWPLGRQGPRRPRRHVSSGAETHEIRSQT